MGKDRFTGIKNELKGYRSLVDGGVSDEKEWEEGVDLVLRRLAPLYSMAQAAPWLLQLKQWQQGNLLSETKFQEVAQKVKTGVLNGTLVSAGKSVGMGGEGSATRMKSDGDEPQAEQQISS